MIQNKKILDLLAEKTEGDSGMREFLTGVFERESEGKQFMNYYRDQIATRAKEKKGAEDK